MTSVTSVTSLARLVTRLTGGLAVAVPTVTAVLVQSLSDQSVESLCLHELGPEAGHVGEGGRGDEVRGHVRGQVRRSELHCDDHHLLTSSLITAVSHTNCSDLSLEARGRQPPAIGPQPRQHGQISGNHLEKSGEIGMS